jgi:hypothetical protein
MDKDKIIGIALLGFSMLLSLTNIFSTKITGGFIGTSIETSFITILTFVFFIGGLGMLFLNSLEKRIIAGLIAGGIAVGGIGYKIHSDREKQYITDVKITAPYWTELGKFQRTYRWDSILDKVEQEHNLPKGLLKGLAMRESYGDPLRLNSGKDGGAGLFMFQPKTARLYGLKVFGKSNKFSADIAHGKELRKLIAKNKNDYTKMAKIDERFDIKKSAEAAAHYLRDDFKRYGSWDKALSAYNQGTPAPNPEKTEHVSNVREYQKYYNKRDKH